MSLTQRWAARATITRPQCIMIFYKLEALRGFAAFYVVLNHTIPHTFNYGGLNFGFLFRFGQEAVILFFLLSGFVVNYSHRKSSHNTFNVYFIKRFSRIYVPLIIVFILGYIHSCLKSGYLIDPELRSLALNLLMLQDVPALKPNVLVAPYMGNTPLWSLSYEWWFYMLYFPIQKYCTNIARQSQLVFLAAFLGAVLYTVHPNFIARILMYLSIWWSGVYISNLVLDGRGLTIRSLTTPIFGLSAVTIILSCDAFAFVTSGGKITVGLHPFLELRHHIFALFSIAIAILWMRLNWWGFDATIGRFKVLAPTSYAIYISHQYLVVDANYLSFLRNKPLEYALYFLILLLFSWLVEIKLYPPIATRLKKLGDRRARAQPVS